MSRCMARPKPVRPLGRARDAIVALVAVAALACGTSTAAGPAPSAPPGGAVITANALVFDRTELSVPAGRPFALLFENRESAPHNVSILTRDGRHALFTGDVFSGPASRTYEVPGLAAGEYQFRCDLHPQMAGTLRAS